MSEMHYSHNECKAKKLNVELSHDFVFLINMIIMDVFFENDYWTSDYPANKIINFNTTLKYD